MIPFILLIFALALPVPARADDTDSLCRFQVSHRAGDDVAYRPGVDVTGNLVTPADLDAPLPLPPKIGVPLTVDLADHINQELPKGMELQAPFGIIDVYGDGRVVYNGRDLTEALAVLCAEEGAAEPTEAGPAAAPAQAAPAEKPPVKNDDDIIWGEGH